jgi:hypothetical protein
VVLLYRSGAVRLRFCKAFIEALASPAPPVFWIVLAGIFTVSGAFGSGEHFPPVPRLVFWLTVVGAALSVGVALRVAVQALRPGTSYLPAALAASFVGALILGQVLPPILLMFDLAPPGTILARRFESTLVILFLGLSFAVMRHLLHREARDPAPAGNGLPRPRLLGRLPDEVAGDILHLSVRNHHVEVATVAGTTRLFMRFADALNELEGAEGFRVHRSHWVARKAVIGTERAKGRSFLRLTTGARVPVSRAYLGALAALDPVQGAPSGTATTHGPSTSARPRPPKRADSSRERASRPPV